jgi:alpha-beta hydrolase superfamily lysophospholipase
MNVDITIDVTDAAGFGEPAWIAATVHLPDERRTDAPQVVCFAKPGAGYSRRYYSLDLPGPTRGAQADWHTARGWIFIAMDHLGVGDSSLHDKSALVYGPMARAAHAAESIILDRLRDGTLVDGFASVQDPVVIGIGQSLGACMTVVQQAHHRTYEGIAVLGYSVLRTQLPPPPGHTPWIQPWALRDHPALVLNGPAITTNLEGRDLFDEIAWAYFPDDVDRSEVRFWDSTAPWAAANIPGVVATVVAPGAIATEAASIDVPVLLAMGDRDVVPEPRDEVRAYLSTTSIDLYTCPRMGHMHNFASTRILLWERIAAWAQWVCAQAG